MSMLSARRVLLSLLLVVPATVSSQGSGEAPRQPLVMAHGIRSGEATWNVAKDALFSTYPVWVKRKTTDWTASPVDQATDLEQTLMLGLPDTTLVIAHSGGGIVMRQAALDNAPMRGLLTIGSPNQGAPAAIAILNGSIGSIAAPLFGYGTLMLGLWNFEPGENIAAYYFWGALAANVGAIGTIVTNSVLGAMDFNASYPVWNSYVSYGAYQQGINSPASMATQAQNVPIRGFVRTRINDPNLALFRLNMSEPDAELMHAFVYVVAFNALVGSFDLAEEHCWQFGGNNASRCAFAFYMGEASIYLGTLLQRYCGLAHYDQQLGPSTCLESDALIPFEKQQWGEDGWAFPYFVAGVAHTEQTTNGEVIDRMKDFLRVQGGVAKCGTGPVTYLLLGFYPLSALVGTSPTFPVVQNDACGGSTTTAQPVTGSSSDPEILSVVGTSVSGVQVTAHAIGTVVLTVQAAGQTRSQVVNVVGL